MSRAFVSEGNGCGYCYNKQTECIYAELDGSCMLSTCRNYSVAFKDSDAKGTTLSDKTN